MKLIIVCLTLLAASFGHATVIEFQWENPQSIVGEPASLIATVTGAPPVYGVQIEGQLQWADMQLSINDADEVKSGNQLSAGDFMGPAKTLFWLRNEVKDNQFFYITSRLHPAEPVAGKGELFRLTFTPGSEGSVTIAPELVAKFGTTEGESITAQVILPAKPLMVYANAAAVPKSQNNLFIAIFIAGCIAIGLMLVLLRKKKAAANTAVAEVAA